MKLFFQFEKQKNLKTLKISNIQKGTILALFRYNQYLIIMTQKKNIKIVIVEDDIYYNKLLNKYISTVCNHQLYPHYHFDVKTYLNAHDAIEELEDDTNIFILDYYLQNSDEDEQLTGLDMVEHINENCFNPKIIMLSSQSSPGVTSLLFSKGIYQYVDKNNNTKNRVGSIVHHLISSNQIFL